MIKLFKTTIFKLGASLALLALLVGAAIGTTIALFTDTRSSTGTFTLGNVYIDMTEAAVISDSFGNLIENPDRPRVQAADTTEGGLPNIHDYGVVFPGQSIHKDPTVTNVGDVNAWIAVKVIIEDGVGDIHRLYRYSEEYDDIDIEGLLQGGLLDQTVHVDDWMGNEFVCYNEYYAMVQVSNHSTGRYEFYFIMLNQFAPGESVEIFDTLYINKFFGNNEMLEFKEFKITVEAYATQTNGFGSCYEAMTTAFPTRFGAIANAIPTVQE